MESAFRRPLPTGLTVIETLRLPSHGAGLVPRHLARMARTCAGFGVPFDPDAVSARLDAARGASDLRARLTMDLEGRLDLSTGPVPPAATVWRVALAAEPVVAGDPWRTVKTSERGPYDRARAAMSPDLDEVIFLNDRGRVTEGAITTVFVRRGPVLLTPPVADGALPGILREVLIEQGRAVEARLDPDDLASGEVAVGNALRGLLPARLLPGRPR